MAICEQCNAVYEAKRADSRFCSDKCRKALSRTITPDKVKSDIISDKTAVEDCAGATISIGADTNTPCNCGHCQSKSLNKSKKIINHGAYKPSSELADNEINRVPVPGDADYVGCLSA